MKRTAAALASFLMLALLAAPSALAANGEGWAGKASDKTITFFMFAVMIFFVVLVIGGSLIYGHLENKKERRRSDLERLS